MLLYVILKGKNKHIREVWDWSDKIVTTHQPSHTESEHVVGGWELENALPNHSCLIRLPPATHPPDPSRALAFCAHRKEDEWNQLPRRSSGPDNLCSGNDLRRMLANFAREGYFRPTRSFLLFFLTWIASSITRRDFHFIRVGRRSIFLPKDLALLFIGWIGGCAGSTSVHRILVVTWNGLHRGHFRGFCVVSTRFFRGLRLRGWDCRRSLRPYITI